MFNFMQSGVVADHKKRHGSMNFMKTGSLTAIVASVNKFIPVPPIFLN